MLLVLAAPDSKDALRRELAVAFPQHHRELEPRLFACEATTGTLSYLACDVIAEADRTAELLLRWLTNACCQNFVVTLKVDDSGSVPLLESLKRELPLIAALPVQEF